MSANDGQLLLAAARAENGIALLSEYLVMPALKAGELANVLKEYPSPELWVKALIPELVCRWRASVLFRSS